MVASGIEVCRVGRRVGHVVLAAIWPELEAGVEPGFGPRPARIMGRQAG